MIKRRKSFHRGVLPVCLWHCLSVFLLAAFSTAAYLTNVPIELIQPNGDKVQCFVTGDEYYRRVHDENGYTIVKDPDTGYYVYAIKEDGELIPSKLIVGETPLEKLQQVGILPNLADDPEKRPSPDEVLPPPKQKNRSTLQKKGGY